MPKTTPPVPAVRPNALRRLPLVWSLMLLACVAAPTDSAHGQALVVRDGQFTQNGQEYRGLGVNYYSAFLRTLRDDGDGNPNTFDRSFDAGFADLGASGIPFARINAGGFWPDDWALYQNDKTEYFRRFDAVVDSAQAHGVQLVPTLFWNHYSIPDLFPDEAVSAWGDPNSQTRQFADQYAADVVSRYADRDTILMWEFANEFNLGQDFATQPTDARINVNAGTPAQRTDADLVSSDAVRDALADFAQTVADLDPTGRAVSSGHSVERTNAFFRRNRDTPGTNPDTAAEFITMTADDHAAVDTLSVHAYYHSLLGISNQAQTDPTRRFTPDLDADYGDVLDVLLTASDQTGKPLFLGEFGVSDGDNFNYDVPGDPTPETTTTQERLEYLLSLLSEKEIPLAAIWVYDDINADRAEFNIPIDPPGAALPDDPFGRRIQLERIAEVNADWVASIPEPGSLATLTLFLGLAAARRRSA
ncbi:MAG: cellulase family glycosylhydrolase [Planctomycetota bacterium]